MKKEIKTYLSELPAERRKRIEEIRKAFVGASGNIEETMKYKMPTYEKGSNWTAIGNQKNYVCVYFCSEEIIANIKKRHPEISTGKGCVRIKDNQEIPIVELVKSFKKAMKYKRTG